MDCLVTSSGIDILQRGYYRLYREGAGATNDPSVQIKGIEEGYKGWWLLNVFSGSFWSNVANNGIPDSEDNNTAVILGEKAYIVSERDAARVANKNLDFRHDLSGYEKIPVREQWDRLITDAEFDAGLDAISFAPVVGQAVRVGSLGLKALTAAGRLELALGRQFLKQGIVVSAKELEQIAKAVAKEAGMKGASRFLKRCWSSL